MSCIFKLFIEKPVKDLEVATILIPKRIFFPDPQVLDAPEKPGSNLIFPNESK